MYLVCCAGQKLSPTTFNRYSCVQMAEVCALARRSYVVFCNGTKIVLSQFMSSTFAPRSYFCAVFMPPCFFTRTAMLHNQHLPPHTTCCYFFSFIYPGSSIYPHHPFFRLFTRDILYISRVIHIALPRPSVSSHRRIHILNLQCLSRPFIRTLPKKPPFSHRMASKATLIT